MNRPLFVTVSSLVVLTATLLFGFQNCAGFSSLTSSSKSRDSALVRMGDMLVPQSFQRALVQSNAGIRTQAATGLATFTVVGFYKWPGGLVPLRFDADITPAEKSMIFAACADWGQQSRVHCVEATTELTVLRIKTDEPGCFASLGFALNHPGLLMNLNRAPSDASATGCMTPFVAAHEFGHVLGLLHEHQRYDRDQYIDILTADIPAEQLGAYERAPAESFMQSEYDFNSIMHYGRRQGSVARAERIHPKNGQALAELYVRSLSASDRQVIKDLYELPDWDQAINQINSYYVNYLGRAIDQEGADYWGLRALAGLSMAKIEAAIRDSAEAVQRRQNQAAAAAVAAAPAPAPGAPPVTLRVTGQTTGPINVHAYDASLNTHDQFGLSAQGVGQGALTFRWLKDGVEVAESNSHVGTHEQVLTVYFVALEDAGSYTCAISDGVNTVYSQPVRVNVAWVAAAAPAASASPAPAPAAPAPEALVPIYRFYHPITGEHFMTTSYAEGVGAGYHFEGQAFQTLANGVAGSHALYRCYLPSGIHMVSPDSNCEGQRVEGTYGFVFDSPGEGRVAIYRLRNPAIGDYLITTSSTEGVSVGYTLEGPLGFAR